MFARHRRQYQYEETSSHCRDKSPQVSRSLTPASEPSVASNLNNLRSRSPTPMVRTPAETIGPHLSQPPFHLRVSYLSFIFLQSVFLGWGQLPDSQTLNSSFQSLASILLMPSSLSTFSLALVFFEARNTYTKYGFGKCLLLVFLVLNVLSLALLIKTPCLSPSTYWTLLILHIIWGCSSVLTLHQDGGFAKVIQRQ